MGHNFVMLKQVFTKMWRDCKTMFLRQSWPRLKQLWMYVLCAILVLVMDDMVGFRKVIHEALIFEVKFEAPYSVTMLPCRYLLHRSKSSRRWAEDFALQEAAIQDHLLVSNVSTSKLILMNNTSHFNANDVITVRVHMHDGYGRPKNIGGDLVRVWIRDKARGAGAIGHVTDHDNGTYIATVRLFWKGTTEVVASLISPRETIAINFRRRYTCPQTVHDTAVFQHPKEDIQEETLCNTEPFVPGYDVICNLTLENYGHPWYCGKPRKQRLLCNDWSIVNDKNMWNLGLEQPYLSATEKFLLHPKNRAVMFPHALKVFVHGESKGIQERERTCIKCCEVNFNRTWNRRSPIGFFFNSTWTNSQCRGTPNGTYLANCLRNATVLLIGDSTLRQFHAGIQRKVPCIFITDSWSKSGKHRPVTCYNHTLNFTLTWAPHGLPFSTKGTPRQYLRPISTYLNQINSYDSRYIVVIHSYAHLLSYHSSVFQKQMQSVRHSVAQLLQRTPGVKVIIKGPHSWAFEKASYQSMWMIDAYAKVYHDILHEEFRTLQGNVMYLDSLDMTIAHENSHLHAPDNTIEQLIDQMFYHVCHY